MLTDLYETSRGYQKEYLQDCSRQKVSGQTAPVKLLEKFGPY
jgi:hypothetical protein